MERLSQEDQRRQDPQILIQFDRLDIHMGDHDLEWTREVDASSTLQQVVDLVTARLPEITEGWHLRMRISGEWTTVATTGPRNEHINHLVPNALIEALAEDGILEMIGTPAREVRAT